MSSREIQPRKTKRSAGHQIPWYDRDNEDADWDISHLDSVMGELMPVQHIEHREWSVIRPPDTGKVQAQWSKLITPVRALAIGFLFLTLYWWRFAIAVLIVVTIVTLWRMS